MSDVSDFLAYAAVCAGAGDVATSYGPSFGVHAAQGEYMAPGTSPAVAQWKPQSQYQQFAYAFHANTGKLFSMDPDRGLAQRGGNASLMPGTSPSITTLASGDFAIAFQRADGELCTSDPDHDLWPRGLGMMAGTSPTIAAYAGSQLYAIAFQANTGSLWTLDPYLSGGQDRQLGMMAGTSPSIATYSNEKLYAIAFQANTGRLWTLDPTGKFAREVTMNSGTSPSLACFGPAPVQNPTWGTISMSTLANEIWMAQELVAPANAVLTGVTLQQNGDVVHLNGGHVTHQGVTTGYLLPGVRTAELNGLPVNGEYSGSLTYSNLQLSDWPANLRLDWG